MTYLVGSVMTKSQSRLFKHLNNILILTTSFSISVHWVLYGAVKFEPNGAQTYYAKQFPRRIFLPLHGIFEAAVQGQKLNQIEVIFKEERDPDDPGIVPGTFLELLTNIINPVFVQFFEDHRPWLEENFLPAQCPPILVFGRVIRNAISHGGRCDIRGKKAQPVNWYHLTYSSDDNGRQIINEDIIFADLLILMFEMSDCLDQLGCPLVD
jgi:hypothetical protein